MRKSVPTRATRVNPPGKNKTALTPDLRPGRTVGLDQTGRVPVSRGLTAAVAAGTTLGVSALAITTIATAAIAATATIATTFTAGGTILAGFGFIHTDRTTMEVLVVQSGNSSLRLLGIRHLDEAEASRFARKLVHNDAGRRNRAIRFKGLTKIGIGRRVRKIPNEYIHSLSYSTITVANLTKQT